MKINIVEKTSGKEVSTIGFPWKNQNKEIADTTTTNFQLDISHKKRKEKDGEYIVEVYHSYKNTSRLIGTTTIIKDGLILF